MNKYSQNGPTWWGHQDGGRTAASVIVNPTTPLSPNNRPRLKLDDLIRRKENQLQRQNTDQTPKRPLHRQMATSDLKQYNYQKYSPPPISRSPPLETPKKGYPLNFEPLSAGRRVDFKEGQLTSYKSEKTLPSFLRNHTRQLDRSRSKGLSVDNFKTIKRLGQGRFGTVFLVRQISTNFIFALKVMNKKKIIADNLLGQFIRQLKIQSFLEHPNIIRCYGYFSDKQNFYAVLQLGCDGQLYDVISSGATLSQESTSFIIGSLLDAVSLMHQHKILHRDIKPENVVLVHGNIKLCDFGWAVNKKQQLRSTYCGTPLYLSPELLQGERYDEKVDLWAVGVMTYELNLGCSPFDINEQEDLHKIITDEVTFPKKSSKEFKQFIRNILKKNPKERMNCKQLMRLEFIQKYKDIESCEELCR